MTKGRSTPRPSSVSPVSPLRPSRGTSTFSNTSSSSGSSGSSIGGVAWKGPARRPDVDGSHSSKFSISIGSSSVEIAGSRSTRPYHHYASSGTLVYSSGSGNSMNSPASNVLPPGNICPPEKIGKTSMMCWSTTRSDVLSTGMASYGHRSIMRGIGKARGDAGVDMVRRVMVSSDVEEVKKVGNDLYKRGQFREALKLYDRVIAMCPNNAACCSSRAVMLMAIGRLGEAVRECKAVLRTDPGYGHPRQCLTFL